MSSIELKIVARIHTDFPEKFGIPRQSGLINALRGRIVFEKEYRNSEALRGIEGYSHLWLIWQFSETIRETWSPTVRPPRLGGNERIGVFATRSPFRPNAIGLSSVELEKVEWDSEDGPVLWVRGADLMNGTPIFDIKPYLAYTDSHPDATVGFTAGLDRPPLTVECEDVLLEKVPQQSREALLSVLASDPRPRYQNDPARVYGLTFGGVNVRFRIEAETVIVTDVE